MGFTIATHNGSVVARDHNIRNKKIVSKESHIDPNGIHETWIDERPKQAYERLFGKAVAAYNQKQTREDRKITNYYNDICKDSKKHPVYEMIVGIGNHDNRIDDATGKQIMREFVDTWAERNPNLALIGAYYHADEEGVPHVHCDYVPVAHGYSRGMETQTGLVKALGEMGFYKKGKATAQIQWEQRENNTLETLCKARGLEIDHPREENIKHLNTDAYKASQRLTEATMQADRLENRIESLNNQQKQLSEECRNMESQLEELGGKVRNAQEIRSQQTKTVPFMKDKIIIGHKDYADLVVSATANEDIEQAKKECERRNAYLDDRELEIHKRDNSSQKIIEKAKKAQDDAERYRENWTQKTNNLNLTLQQIIYNSLHTYMQDLDKKHKDAKEQIKDKFLKMVCIRDKDGQKRTLYDCAMKEIDNREKELIREELDDYRANHLSHNAAAINKALRLAESLEQESNEEDYSMSMQEVEQSLADYSRGSYSSFINEHELGDDDYEL